MITICTISFPETQNILFTVDIFNALRMQLLTIGC